MSITSIPATSALVLIDLQQMVMGRPLQPRTGQDVLANAVKLAAEFRKQKLPVVLVRVSFSKDGGDIVKTEVDSPMAFDPSALKPGWDQIVPELMVQESDIIITKRNWGAFFGTDLDVHLRRRGVSTIILGGIATNFGVESTARQAYEANYQQIFVEDAMSSLSLEGHQFSTKFILPRLGQMSSTDEILQLMQSSN